ncbi:MAG: putative urea ABC transporter substrate-binding protein [Oleiphilaceae bacterium]|nr:putative urea ABC transporter substrate-binding protein [Oleiphilaceae bacterium]
MKTLQTFKHHSKRLIKNMTIALAASALLAPVVAAEERDSFSIAWSIYAGWMPWDYIEDSGLIDKWADKYDIEIEIVQINDYIESINQYTSGRFDGVVATSMDALSIPSAGGVDTTALIVGDYSNGNDGLVMKGGSDLRDLEGQSVNLVELSVSHYILARALESVGLEERDVEVINTGDADIVSAFSTETVRNAVTWNPQLNTIASMPDAHRAYDSAMVPGHIKDLTIVNTETLKANPALGKALTGAWFELMAVMGTDTEEGRKIRAFLGKSAGTDREGYEAQLAGMKMFWQAEDAVAFIASDTAYEAMDSVREFSWEKGLLGQNAASADFIGIAFPDGKMLGDGGNIKLRFDTTYMQMAADGKL